MPLRLTDKVEIENSRDWLSWLLQMIPVRGTLDYRCSLGAPWPIDFAASEFGEIPYHVIRGGSAELEDPEGGPTSKLITGDILLLPHGSAGATATAAPPANGAFRTAARRLRSAA